MCVWLFDDIISFKYFNLSYMSYHDLCFMITQVSKLLIQVKSVQEWKRKNLVERYRNFHMSLIVIISSTIGRLGSRGLLYKDEWRFKIVSNYPIDSHNMRRWGLFTCMYLLSKMSRRWGFFKSNLLKYGALFVTTADGPF